MSMSHVVCVITDGTHVLVCKYGSMYVLPDSAIHGKLEWNRSDRKRLAAKLVRHMTFGILIPDLMETFKVFGIREHHRVVKLVVNNLPEHVETMGRVAAHFNVEFPIKLVSLDSDRLAVEARHCVDAACRPSDTKSDSNVCSPNVYRPQVSIVQTTDDTKTASDDDSSDRNVRRAASPETAT